MQTMSDKTYQGWSNYETWVVKLWLDNDEGSYNLIRELAGSAQTEAVGSPQVEARVWTVQNATRFILADSIQEHVEEYVPDLGGAESASMYSDLLGHAIDQVNWQEIADNILSE